MELYDKISFLRKNRGLSQQELASLLDVSRQAIYKWEQGITSPDITKLPELAQIFQVTVDDLLNSKLNEDDLIKKSVNVGNNNSQQRRSMLDYLLMIPIGLGIGILIFMFFMVGGMFVGFLYIFDLIALLSPIYAFTILFTNYSNIGSILICVAIIVGGIGSIYPLWLLANWWKNMYLNLSSKLIKKLKSFSLRKVL